MRGTRRTPAPFTFLSLSFRTPHASLRTPPFLSPYPLSLFSRLSLHISLFIRHSFLIAFTIFSLPTSSARFSPTRFSFLPPSQRFLSLSLSLSLLLSLSLILVFSPSVLRPTPLPSLPPHPPLFLSPFLYLFHPLFPSSSLVQYFNNHLLPPSSLLPHTYFHYMFPCFFFPPT